MVTSYEDIISDLKKRIFRPVYFLAGEEPYYIDLITGFIENNVLTDAEKAFNQIKSTATTLCTAIIEIRRFPMMRHQLLSEAQVLRKIDDLLNYKAASIDYTGHKLQV